MRVLAGVAVGLTLAILAHILGWPLIGWLFVRIPPATHPASRPFIRTYKRGVLVEDRPIGG